MTRRKPKPRAASASNNRHLLDAVTKYGTVSEDDARARLERIYDKRTLRSGATSEAYRRGWTAIDWRA